MTPSEALRAELGARCLHGLAEVAAALAGPDPAVVCERFAEWEGEARRPWPWLAGMCWAALEPLGIDFPADDRDAVVAGRLLVGSETDPDAVIRAIAALRRREPPASAARAARAADSHEALAHRRVSSAVEAFWEAFLRSARRLHEYVREGDRSGADDLVAATRRRLEELADRIAQLADGSLALVGAPDRPVARVSGGALPRPVLVDGEPTGPLVAPEAVSRSRPARRQAPARPDRPGAGRPKRPGDGHHRYERTRQHRYAPVAFALMAVVAALYWIVWLASG